MCMYLYQVASLIEKEGVNSNDNFVTADQRQLRTPQPFLTLDGHKSALIGYFNDQNGWKSTIGFTKYG